MVLQKGLVIMTHKTKWMYTKMDYDFTPLGENLGVEPQVVEILAKRGLHTPEAMRAYLRPAKEDIQEPWLLKDMEKACEIILLAKQNGEKVRIIGDYDVDGIMSTAILMKGFARLGVQADYVIPDRIEDGYGIRSYMAKQAKEDGVSLIVTCDNGISAMEAIVCAKELGLQVVLTDHHDIPYVEKDGEKEYVIPPADAVVNPKQEDCPYPCKLLCGAAVAYKLVCALYEKEGKKMQEKDLLVFAAIATVCDVVPLVEENRTLVKYGLDSIHDTDNPGLDALIRIKELRGKQIRAYHLGFVIGPCINAAGRIDTARLSLRMLLAENEEAESLAEELANLNEKRKQITLQAEKAGIEAVESGELASDKVLLVHLPDCHESIAGIVAGRIRERYYKPVFVVVDTQKGAKGSGRSIPQYSMYEEMNRCKELFTEFGGHPLAAGFSLPTENIPLLREKLNELTNLNEEDLIEKITVDAIVPLQDCHTKLVDDLALLEPFGQGNKKPVFAATGVTLFRAVLVGKNKNVLRLQVRQEGVRGNFTVVDFEGEDMLAPALEERYGAASFAKLMAGEEAYRMDVLYQPNNNVYNGVCSVEFIAKGYR